MELEDVESYLQETDCDDQSTASSFETLVRSGMDLNDEYDFGSELGCGGSGPSEEGSEHDHMEEEGELDLLEEDGDLL